jgi:hypothetical protein
MNLSRPRSTAHGGHGESWAFLHVRRVGFVLRGFIACAAIFWGIAPAAAHDIPTDVRVQLFLRPEGQVLRLIARMPVAAMNDVDWPVEGVRLDLSRVEPLLNDAANAWVARRIDVYEGDRRLHAPRISAVRVSLPADQSFASYATALAHVTSAPLHDDTEVVARQAWIDALLEYDIASDQSPFSIEPRFSLVGLQTLTVVRFLAATGIERAFQFHNDPGLVRLDPRWFQAASRFVVDGFFHILGGIDHLLFLFCLVIPFRRLRTLVPIVTAFTVAHSITLIASAYDMAPDALWFPPLVETLIAASIVYMALENIIAMPEEVRLKADTTKNGPEVRLKADTTKNGPEIRLKPDASKNGPEVRQ